jgi:cytosine/adenosine deaminase-related metal-dependent hydrolase
MELALVNAAIEAGIRITVLDSIAQRVPTLQPPLDATVTKPRLVYAKGRSRSGVQVAGAALHSVRAVSPDEMATAVSGLPERVPIHIHVSEQPRENTNAPTTPRRYRHQSSSGLRQGALPVRRAGSRCRGQ